VPRRVARATVGPVIAIVLSIPASASGAPQSIPDNHGVVHACYGGQDGREAHLVTGGTCANGETAVKWNAVGPRGFQGSRGDPGPKGDRGPEGKSKKSWSDVAQGAAAIAGIVALIVGGLWAYFLFVKGRTFSNRLEPSAEGELLQVNGKTMVRLKLVVKNAGASVFTFADHPKAVYLYATAAADWVSAANVLWSDPYLRLTRILENHDWIEGGETIVDEVLVSVPDGDWLAYRLEVRLGSRSGDFRRWLASHSHIRGDLQWRTTVVVPGNARPAV